MKVFNFIVINKSNMAELNHFSQTDSAACCILNNGSGRNGGFNPDNWIVIKHEKKIVDLSSLRTIGGDWVSMSRALRLVLDAA
jgi:hypothetical protein